MSGDLVFLPVGAGFCNAYRVGKPRLVRGKKRIALPAIPAPGPSCSSSMAPCFAGFRLRRDSARPAAAAAHLHVRLHARRIRAGSGLHRDGRSRPADRRSRGYAIVSRGPPSIFTRTRLLGRSARARRAGGARGGGRRRRWRLPITTRSSACARRSGGRGAGIRLVPGVEISALWRPRRSMCWGLWIDPASAAAEDNALSSPKTERRHARMRRMCAALSKLRLPGDGASRCSGGSSRRADSLAPRGGSEGAKATLAIASRMRFASTWAAASPSLSPPIGPPLDVG